MKAEEKLKKLNIWKCLNCNHKYMNPEEEMELVIDVNKGGVLFREYRCNKCEAHLLVECKIKLDWQNAEIRRG